MEEVTRGWRKVHEDVQDFTPRQIIFGWAGRRELHGRDLWHVLRTTERHTGFLWKKLKRRDHLEDLSADERLL
jgi:hypothetical protein